MDKNDDDDDDDEEFRLPNAYVAWNPNPELCLVAVAMYDARSVHLALTRCVHFDCLFSLKWSADLHNQPRSG